jgi:hypothetical protein
VLRVGCMHHLFPVDDVGKLQTCSLWASCNGMPRLHGAQKTPGICSGSSCMQRHCILVTLYGILPSVSCHHTGCAITSLMTVRMASRLCSRSPRQSSSGLRSTHSQATPGSPRQQPLLITHQGMIIIGETAGANIRGKNLRRQVRRGCKMVEKGT